MGRKVAKEITEQHKKQKAKRDEKEKNKDKRNRAYNLVICAADGRKNTSDWTLAKKDEWAKDIIKPIKGIKNENRLSRFVKAEEELAPKSRSASANSEEWA